MNYIFIDSNEKQDRVGIIQDGRLVEYHIEKKNDENLRGNIYRARVINVLRGINAAFVDIGVGKNAYLPLRETLNESQLSNISRYSITDTVKGGETVLVQVEKEEVGDKGAKITTRFELPGRYLVFTPFSSKIAVSNKIENEDEINRLISIGEEIRRNNKGFIFRTTALGLGEEEFKREYDYLNREYEKIMREREFLPIPKLMYAEKSLSIKIVRDVFNPFRQELIVNDKEIYEEILSLDSYFPRGFEKQVKYDENFTIEGDSIIQKGIEEGLAKKVSLKSGGSIVIEETEALTSIDVNTGKYIGGYSLDETVFKTNMEATSEIARQVRLRDISGIIIIDLISMKDNDSMSKIIDNLRKEFREDRNRPYIVGLTRLGLLEVTRKRMGNSLNRELYNECRECSGSGKVKKKN